jgi:hypothetical protein
MNGAVCSHPADSRRAIEMDDEEQPARHGSAPAADVAERGAWRCSVCLTGKVRSGCCGLLEGDVVSEAFELFDEASGLAFGVAVGVVVAAEVAVGLAGREHVPDRAEHRVLDRAEGAFVAAAWLEPPVLGFEVVALDADGGDGGFLRARSPATWIRRASCRSGACRPTGRCPGSGRPMTPNAGRWQSTTCRRRSRR